MVVDENLSIKSIAITDRDKASCVRTSDIRSYLKNSDVSQEGTRSKYQRSEVGQSQLDN